MTCRIQLKGTDGEPCPVVLAKPQSYMNTSGGPLSKLMRELGVLAPEILVVHDEVDLSQGEVRVKCGGGLNAHNGLRSSWAPVTSPACVWASDGHPGGWASPTMPCANSREASSRSSSSAVSAPQMPARCAWSAGSRFPSRTASPAPVAHRPAFPVAASTLRRYERHHHDDLLCWICDPTHYT